MGGAGGQIGRAGDALAHSFCTHLIMFSVKSSEVHVAACCATKSSGTCSRSRKPSDCSVILGDRARSTGTNKAKNFLFAGAARGGSIGQIALEHSALITHRKLRNRDH